MRARGFSLVECTVAAVLLSGGLLAVIASQRAMRRLELLGRRTAEASEIAVSRLDWLRATGCSAAGGTAAGPVDETWTTAPGPVLRADVAVSFLQDGRARIARYSAGFVCAASP